MITKESIESKLTTLREEHQTMAEKRAELIDQANGLQTRMIEMQGKMIALSEIMQEIIEPVSAQPAPILDGAKEPVAS